jgi:hypothetical protein
MHTHTHNTLRHHLLQVPVEVEVERIVTVDKIVEVLVDNPETDNQVRLLKHQLARAYQVCR